MEKLKDIKPLVEIPDYSFYLYVAIITAVTIFTALAVYLLIRVFTKKKEQRRKKVLNMLKNMDLSKTKEAAYTFTRYGKELVRDESSYKIYAELLRKLARYKYKKEVPNRFDKETMEHIKLFLRVVDE